jgi:regulator of RNase E activity RraA
VAALESLPPGDVLVAATGGYTGCARSGDAIVCGVDGVVVVPRGRPDEVIERLPASRKAGADLDQAVRNGLRLPRFLAKD